MEKKLRLEIDVEEDEFNAINEGVKKFHVTGQKVSKGDGILFRETVKGKYTGRTYNTRVIYIEALTELSVQPTWVPQFIIGFCGGGFLTLPLPADKHTITAQVSFKLACPTCYTDLTSVGKLGYCNNCNQHYSVSEHGELTAVPA